MKGVENQGGAERKKLHLLWIKEKADVPLPQEGSLLLIPEQGTQSYYR